MELDDVADFYNDDVDIDFKLRDTKSKHYFVWESFEKGEWNAVIETDKPFDQSKLILKFKCLIYEDGEQEKWLVTSVLYDDKEYGIEPETEGKSYELSFHTVRC